MKLKNTGASPRHFPYASPDPTCGRTLNPGQASAEIPLDRIHDDKLMADIDSGLVDLTLSTEELVYLERVLAAHERKTKQQPVAKRVKQKPKPKKKPKGKRLRHSPKPDVKKTSTAVKPIDEIDPVDLASGRVGLDNLKAANQAPRKVPPGQPDIGQPPGDGLSTGVGQKAGGSSLQEIKQHMGGTV